MGTCDRYDNFMWLSYIKHRLDADVTVEMESHSASCNDCLSRLDFFRKIAAVIDLNSAAPPESWTEEAAAKFESSRPSPQLSNIFGELVFDSYLHGEAVGSRGAEARHVIFDLPKFQVDLAMEYSGRQLNMMTGQLLPKTARSIEAFAESDVELRAAARMYTATPNRFGEFSFTVDTPVTGEPLELRCTFKEGPCVIVLIPC